MGPGKPNDLDRLHHRRWSFANCIFDESNWSLMVAGRRVPVEIKPLALLRVLLLRAGNAVSKEELLDAVWPNVEVVEASLTTAIRKLRTALGDDRRAKPIIETVQRIGYRLAAPVKVEEPATPPDPAITFVPKAPAHPGRTVAHSFPVPPAAPARTSRRPGLLAVAGGLAIGMAAVTGALGLTQRPPATKAQTQYSQADAAEAIRELDIDKIERMIGAGWDPARPWDKQGNDSLTMLLNGCEWDRGHDRRRMLLMARTLVEGGAPIDRRNVFGDTAYSIAKADRYCGPDHPVTHMLEAMCYGGDTLGSKDLCLATYELTAEQREAQGLPPKG